MQYNHQTIKNNSSHRPRGNDAPGPVTFMPFLLGHHGNLRVKCLGKFNSEINYTSEQNGVVLNDNNRHVITCDPKITLWISYRTFERILLHFIITIASRLKSVEPIKKKETVSWRDTRASVISVFCVIWHWSQWWSAPDIVWRVLGIQFSDLFIE